MFKDGIEASDTISKIKFSNLVNNILMSTGWDCVNLKINLLEFKYLQN